MLHTLYYKVSSRASIVDFPACFSGFAFGVCKVELLMSIRVMVVSKTVLFGLPKLEGTTSLDMGMFTFLFRRDPEKGVYKPNKASFEQSEQDAMVIDDVHALMDVLAFKGAARVTYEQQNTEKAEKSYYVVAYWHCSII